MSSIEKHNVDKQLISSVREKFLIEYESDKNSYYESDVEKMKTNDWSIERFALVNKEKEDATLNALVKAMKWRKEFGLLDRQDTYFPKEMYQLLITVPYNKGKSINLIIYKNDC